jgi:hypothetical protein
MKHTVHARFDRTTGLLFINKKYNPFKTWNCSFNKFYEHWEHFMALLPSWIEKGAELNDYGHFFEIDKKLLIENKQFYDLLPIDGVTIYRKNKNLIYLKFALEMEADHDIS